MLKKLLTITALLALSTTSFALTPTEHNEFKTRVENMNWDGRLVLIAYNTATTLGACGTGSLYTVVALGADTVPGLAAIQASFTKNSTNDEYEYTGGAGALISDIVSFFGDISDADMDRALFEELPKAYDETEAAINTAFNKENGYCTNQMEQLLILLGAL